MALPRPRHHQLVMIPPPDRARDHTKEVDQPNQAIPRPKRRSDGHKDGSPRPTWLLDGHKDRSCRLPWLLDGHKDRSCRPAWLLDGYKERSCCATWRSDSHKERLYPAAWRSDGHEERSCCAAWQPDRRRVDFVDRWETAGGGLRADARPHRAASDDPEPSTRAPARESIGASSGCKTHRPAPIDVE
jgi:hypothetical protein